MKKYDLEEVFNEASFPEVTFVNPAEYPYIKSSFKSKGKHITISGASGTGKTTLVQRLFTDLSINMDEVLWINARRYVDYETFEVLFSEIFGQSLNFNGITELLKLKRFIVIDDFHFFKKQLRDELASKLKLFHEDGIRFIIIGIASSAEELLGVDQELGIRNDPYKLSTQSDLFCQTLIAKGTAALGITFSEKLISEIVLASNGVPSIVHVISKIICIESGVIDTQIEPIPEINITLKHIKNAVLRIFHGKYKDKVVGLAQGKQQARSVHNTYYDIVSTIAMTQESEIPTTDLYSKIVGKIEDPKVRSRKATSFYNCLNNLGDVINEKGLDDIIYYKKGAKYISIEDPSFRFYLNLLDINKEIEPHVKVRVAESPYDVAVSFSGDIREKVEEFVSALKALGLTVFYDFDHAADLWGKDLREKLADIYANQALYMVVCLSKSYPEKDWTDFELSIGKSAENKKTSEYLLPLKFDDVKVVGIKETIGYVDVRNVGIEKAAELLSEKINSIG